MEQVDDPETTEKIIDIKAEVENELIDVGKTEEHADGKLYAIE